MSDDTGSWFPVPQEDALPDNLRRLFAKAREQLGFVPNVFRVWAYRPERLSAWFAHFRLLHEPTEYLGVVEREMIAVVVSQANGCLYCLVAHGAALREALGDPVLGERIAFDWRRAGLDPRRAAICAYAEKLTLTPRELAQADHDALIVAGLSLEEACRRARLDVQPHQPHGDGDEHAAERGVRADRAVGGRRTSLPHRVRPPAVAVSSDANGRLEGAPRAAGQRTDTGPATRS